MLWLLASESDDGSFEASIEELTFRLRQPAKEIEAGLPALIEAGFFLATEQPASVLLANCTQVAPQRRDRGETETETETDAFSGFSQFWEIWPSSSRKSGRAKCREAWQRHKLEEVSAQIVAHVRFMARSVDWTKKAGEFIPAPLTYLNGRRWDGADLSPPAPGTGEADRPVLHADDDLRVGASV